METWTHRFVLIYIGQAFSLLGTAAVQFAVIWWLTVHTGSAVMLTLATLVSFVPNMSIGPFAGVWIDRFNRGRVMIAADGLVALSSVVLGVAFILTDAPPVWLVYLALFLRGLGGTFHTPAMQSAIPLLVPAEMLTKAGGWGNLVTSASNMLGPVLGAILMGALSMGPIMLVDILGAVFAIVCLLFVRIPDVPGSGERPDFRADFRQGLAAMRANRPLMAILPCYLLSSLVYMPLSSLFPLFVNDYFHGTAWHNSVVEFVFAGGLMVASLVMGMWGGARRRFLIIAAALGLQGIAILVCGMLPEGGYWGFVVCSFLLAAAGTAFSVPFMAYIQESVPVEVLGKVFSLLMTAATLAMPVGLLVAGPAVEVVGVNVWFFWSGVVTIAAAVLCFARSHRYDHETVTDS